MPIMGITKDGADMMTDYKGMPVLDEITRGGAGCRALPDVTRRYAAYVSRKTQARRMR